MKEFLKEATSLAPAEIYANESRLIDFAKGMEAEYKQLTKWNEVIPFENKWIGNLQNPNYYSLPPHNENVLIRYTVRGDIFKGKVYLGLGKRISSYLVKIDGLSLQDCHKVEVKSWRKIFL